MGVENFHLHFGVIELILGADRTLDTLVLDQATPLVFHVDDPRDVAEISENVVNASISIASGHRSDEKYP